MKNIFAKCATVSLLMLAGSAFAQHAQPSDMPQRIKRSSTVYLERTTENSSWQNCAGAGPDGAGQDSTCVVPYRYAAPAGAATITAGFTKSNPTIGGTGTSLKWTTTNAVNVTVTCSGVASYGPATVPVQGNPSGITLNAETPGTVTCNYTAMNSDNEPATATATATFSPPVPPTITAAFTDPNPSAGLGMPGTSIYWSTANAKTLSVMCYNALSDGSTWGNANSVLTSAPGTYVFKAASAKTVTCNFVATNDVGQTTGATVTANFYNPPPPQTNGWFDPSAIKEGESSAFHWSSANAVYVGICCSGVGFNYCGEQTPNQSWYWFPFMYSTQGVEECNVHAKNAADVWSSTVAQLNVFPAGTPGGSVGSPAPVTWGNLNCGDIYPGGDYTQNCQGDAGDGSSGPAGTE